MGFSETLSALSDPIRRNILTLLREGKLSAGEIVAHFEVTGAAISYHLNKLKKADLIRETKYKNFVYYELNASMFEEVMLWFRQFQKIDLNEKNKGDKQDEE